MIPPFCQSRQGVAGRRRDLLGGRPHGAREGGEHPRVDRVGLGELAAGTGKVASPGRIDPGKADVGRTQRRAKLEVVDAGGLKDDQRIASPTRHQLCDGMWGVGDAFRHADAFIEDIKMMFGDVDSDATRGYDHGACPCDARSVGAASCNCSGS